MEKLSDPLQLIISASVLAQATVKETTIVFISKHSLLKKRAIRQTIMLEKKNAPEPKIVFLVSILKSLILWLFFSKLIPVMAASGSQMARIKMGRIYSNVLSNASEIKKVK